MVCRPVVGETVDDCMFIVVMVIFTLILHPYHYAKSSLSWVFSRRFLVPWTPFQCLVVLVEVVLGDPGGSGLVQDQDGENIITLIYIIAWVSFLKMPNCILLLLLKIFKSWKVNNLLSLFKGNLNHCSLGKITLIPPGYVAFTILKISPTYLQHTLKYGNFLVVCISKLLTVYM